jgi:hypothetical protein
MQVGTAASVRGHQGSDGVSDVARACARRSAIAIAACALALCAALATGGLAVPGFAFADEPEAAVDPFEMAAPVEWEDGSYLIDVDLAGGTGRADIPSPVALEVSEGLGAATLVWTSPNYDYMLVEGKKYLPISKAGENSTFQVPVTAYDEGVSVIGDTTAMGEPHEIEYTLTFDAGTVRDYDEAELPSANPEALAGEGASGDGLSADGTQTAASGAGNGSDVANPDNAWSIPWPWTVFIVCAILSALALGIAIGVMRSYHAR